MSYKDFRIYKKIRVPIKEIVMKCDRVLYAKKGIYEASPINDDVIRNIEAQIECDPQIRGHIIRTEIDNNEFLEFEKTLGFQDHYDKDNSPRYMPKILEYYVANKILDFENHSGDADYIYIDAASANSPWIQWLRKRYKITTYSIDLLTPPDNTGIYIKGDVTKMPFEDESIDSISMQSALETFPNDVDIRFIREAGRVLRKGGTLLIIPIYLSTTYANCFGKKYYNNMQPEKDAKKFIRFGYSGPSTRLYDINHLRTRILETALSVGFEFDLVILDMDKLMVDKWDNYMYSHFGLVLRKAF